ncbi:putative monofunctional glycosyltransferase [Kosakonia phage Kc283]|uniref:Monofunctional glycosyltransferase n=1 Tax=Kosakonia phage Kc283 TaxID=2863195 RepID=A0AAE8BEG0_9CAUD|nr:putative monofunctional glycosyltransferase [Kosakonia phage Kc283]QYN79836.1 putative monofunctional glycosyltransferase [Kosakonia phage Kc283]
MANASLITTSSYSLQLNNLSVEQVSALKALVHYPPNGIKPEEETEPHKELRKVIWEACKNVYP